MVCSIIKLSNLKIVTGNSDVYITFFAVDLEKEQWTKIKEEKRHDKKINSSCELSRNRL